MYYLSFLYLSARIALVTCKQHDTPSADFIANVRRKHREIYKIREIVYRVVGERACARDRVGIWFRPRRKV